MPPQRKKAKTSYVAPEPQVQETDPALHPDLAAQSVSVKMDPQLLHPDLAAASTSLTQDATAQFVMENIVVQAPTPTLPKQRKNAAAASRAAAAAAAAIQAQQLQMQQQQLEQEAEGQVKTETEQEEPAVSVDAAAEFLRTIQERESRKQLSALQTQQDPLIGPDGGIPTDFAALYPVHQAQESYQGFPSADQFNAMVDEYLGSLSPKKQAKALLTQQMYDDILAVLLHPTETKIGSAQFRFWSKKMFKLVSTQVAHIVIHENKPVAVKEQLYDVLVQCHGQASHGGRDKTAAQVFTPSSYSEGHILISFLGSKILFMGPKRTYC